MPDRCRFEVNRILVPGETSQIALQNMQDLVQRLNLQAEVEIRLKPPVYESFTLEPVSRMYALIAQRFLAQ